MKKISTSVLSLATLAVLSTACVKVESLDPMQVISKTFEGKKKKKSTRITKAANTEESFSIGDHNLSVVSTDVIQKKMSAGLIHSATSARAQKILSGLSSSDERVQSLSGGELAHLDRPDLVVGFPLSLLGEQKIFGAVITKVSEKENQDLGGLKLTDITPIHVKSELGRVEVEVISRDDKGEPILDENGKVKMARMIVPSLALIGCVAECTERTKQVDVISIPITAVDEVNGLVFLNVSLLGKAINLVSMLDPNGEYTKLKAIESDTSEVDYDIATLVFDVNSKFIPKDTPEGSEATAPVTEFTVRWYMKLSSSFNPAYESRSPTPEVGFFQTERSKASKIQRFSITESKKIKYYIKNVPEEYRPHFKSALDNWNAKFKETMAIEPLEYEFVEKTDERHARLIPGDIRYNIIEWDEVNKAPYGGLGPSIANQYTGETISANVLIQGPTIVEMYKKWFELSQDVRALKRAGEVAAANKLIREFNEESKSLIKKREEKKFSLTLGKNLAFTVQSQRPELEDPIIKNHFDVVPAGVTYDDYMKGYFTEMVEHELGHNLGLRHNFKGNLGATDSGQKGSAARSIMEYLGRPYRHLNEIGLYDEMAIRYGYAGEAPKRANWFCTDEHQASSPKNIATTSPECSKSDATSDPFSYWESRVKRTLDLIVDLKSSAAPVWKTEEVAAQIQEFTIAFANYAAAAEKTAETWTNFFGKADRPEHKALVKPYVLAKMKALICDPEIAEAIKAKESQEAQALAQRNMEQLQMVVVATNKVLTVFTEEELKCN